MSNDATPLISKAKKAYFRKLYIAFLIDSGQQNLLSLNKATEMPRRTIQTAMEGLADIGIEHEFIQDGVRNRHGYYRITDWGPNNKQWIADNLQYVTDTLQR